MKAITLRNLPPDVARAVRRRAEEKKLSLNRAIVELLQEALGGGAGNGKPREYHDLDFLFGVWTPKEAEAFRKELAWQRRIDPELWK